MTVSNGTKYLALYRVSSILQSESGIGLEAQQIGVKEWVEKNGGTIVKEVFEVVSGKKYLPDRPKLKAAIDLALGQSWTILVFRLDRLSREVFLISQLMKTGCKFKFVDLPEADTFTIHIISACAQRERELISKRCKEASKAVRARLAKINSGVGAARTHMVGISKLNLGKQLKPPRKFTKEEIAVGQAKTAQMQADKARSRYEHLREVIMNLYKSKMTYQEIADEMNRQGYRTPTLELSKKKLKAGITTPTGGAEFRRTHIHRALVFYGILKSPKKKKAEVAA